MKMVAHYVGGKMGYLIHKMENHEAHKVVGNNTGYSYAARKFFKQGYDFGSDSEWPTVLLAPNHPLYQELFDLRKSQGFED